eukprot:608340-Alexandrium_andersonii.AAC.1
MLNDLQVRAGHARIASSPQERLEVRPTGHGVPRSNCRPLRADAGALQAARCIPVLAQELP